MVPVWSRNTTQIWSFCDNLIVLYFYDQTDIDEIRMTNLVFYMTKQNNGWLNSPVGCNGWNMFGQKKVPPYTHPLGRFSEHDLLHNQQGANIIRNDTSSEKLSARCHQRRPLFWAQALFQLWKYRARKIGPRWVRHIPTPWRPCIYGNDDHSMGHTKQAPRASCWGYCSIIGHCVRRALWGAVPRARKRGDTMTACTVARFFNHGGRLT